MTDYQQIVQNQISEVLFPLLDRIFTNYVVPAANPFDPTNVLLQYLLRTSTSGLECIEHGFNSVFLVATIMDNFFVLLKLNTTCLTLFISDETMDSSENSTYIGLSPDRKRQMYVYGVKSGSIGPRISGNILNRLMIEICKRMHIESVFISDGAGVGCYCDSNTEIQHFSVLRVLLGKPTFYSSLPGNFEDPIKAHYEIKLLQNSISKHEKMILVEYMSKMTSQLTCTLDLCAQVNGIISRLLLLLSPHPAFFNYIVKPMEMTTSGGRPRRKNGKGRVCTVRHHKCQCCAKTKRKRVKYSYL